mmetsp:Transcript_39646/g.78018  ORF Transcript_39646/g.78018 Transcript_39646/m.78018 type:complete len:3634 (-) Transcript_39646:369-11270(-)
MSKIGRRVFVGFTSATGVNSATSGQVKISKWNVWNVAISGPVSTFSFPPSTAQALIDNRGRKCADSNDECTCTGTVRFGTGSKFVSSLGAVTCSASTFGNPQGSECFCQDAFVVTARNTPPTSPSLEVQVRDGCGNIREEEGQFDADVTGISPTAKVSTSYSSGNLAVRVWDEKSTDKTTPKTIRISMSSFDIFENNSPPYTTQGLFPVKNSVREHDIYVIPGAVSELGSVVQKCTNCLNDPDEVINGQCGGPCPNELPAGSTLKFRILAKDAYGNFPWKTQKDVITAAFTASWNSESDAPAVPYASKVLYQDSFVAYFIETSTKNVGQRALYINCNGRTITDGGTLQTTIVPGPVSLTNSEVLCGKGATTCTFTRLQANKEFSVYVVPRDDYNNVVQDVKTGALTIAISRVGTILAVPTVNYNSAGANQYSWTSDNWKTSVAGQYNLDIKYDGNTLVHGITPSVLPTDPKSIIFTDTTLPSASAGAQYSFDLQLRDEFDNSVINKPISADVKAVITSPKGVSKTIVCVLSGAPAVENIPNELNAITCSYTFSGRYSMAMSVLALGSYSVQLKFNNINTVSKTFTVDSGAPDAAQSSIEFENGLTTMKAGSNQKVLVSLKDSFGNFVKDRTDVNTLVLKDAPDLVFQTGVAQQTSTKGKYELSFTGYKAGDFKLTMSINGVQLNPQLSVKVTPADQFYLEATGSGWEKTQVTNQTKSFVVTVRDRYWNVRTNVNDLNTLSATSTNTLNSQIIPPAVTKNAAGAGSYEFTYLVGPQGITQKLEVQGAGGVKNSTIITVTADLTTYGTIKDLPPTKEADAAPFTFKVEDKDSTGKPKPFKDYDAAAELEFSVEFKITRNGLVQSYRTTVVNKPTDPNSNVWEAQMSPPSTAGEYEIRVYLNNRVSPACNPCTEKLVVIPGVPAQFSSLDAPSIAPAGVPITFKLTLVDKFNNVHTTPGRNVTVEDIQTLAKLPVTSNQDGTYSGSWNSETTGLKTLRATDSKSSYRFDKVVRVVAGPPGDKSQLQIGADLTKRYEGKAGEEFSEARGFAGLILVGRDQFGNVIDNQTLGLSKEFQLKLDGKAVPQLAVQFVANGDDPRYTTSIYKLVFTPQQINPLGTSRLELSYNGSPIANTSHTFFPSQYDSIEVKGLLNKNFTAADVLFLNITMKDRFNNLITPRTCGGGLASDNQCPDLSMKVSRGYVFGTVPTTSGSTFHQVRYPSTTVPISKAGSYSLVYKFGATSPQASQITGDTTITVIPSVTDPVKTKVKSTPQAVAGVNHEMEIELRDKYNNPSLVDGDKVTICYIPADSQALCSAGDRIRFNADNCVSKQINYNRANGFVTTSTNITLADTYKISVEVNDQSTLPSSTPDCQSNPYQVDVIPAEFDPANSGIEGSGMSEQRVCYYGGGDDTCSILGGRAGQTSSIKVILRDRFSNRLTKALPNGAKVTIGGDPSGYSPAADDDCAFISSYPGYKPGKVGGSVSVTKGSNGNLKLTYHIEGLLPFEENGLHIHAGVSCAEHSLVKGHYWQPQSDPDPWGAKTKYKADANGVADGCFEVNAGFTTAEVEQHAVVIHEGTAGVRVGCGTINNGVAQFQDYPNFKHQSVTGDVAVSLSGNSLTMEYRLTGLLPSEQNKIAIMEGTSCGDSRVVGNEIGTYSKQFTADKRGKASGVIQVSGLQFKDVEDHALVIFEGTGPARVGCGRLTNNKKLALFTGNVNGDKFDFTYNHNVAAEYRLGIKVDNKEVRNGDSKCNSRLTVFPSTAVRFDLPATPDATAGEPVTMQLKAYDQFNNPVDNTQQASHEFLFEAKPISDSVANSVILQNGYNINLASSQLLRKRDFHEVFYVYEWSGKFQLSISLKSNGQVYSQQTNQSVASAYCDNAQVRCPDNSCEATRAACKNSCQAGQVKCRNYATSQDECKATISECSCPTGMNRCPAGHCAPSGKCGTAVTCTNAFGATLGSICSSDQTTCAATPGDCPAGPSKCPDGFVSCPDGRTCEKTFASCGVPVSSCPGAVCPDGKCVSSLANCATAASCPTGKVRCQDGSCKDDSAKCPDNFKCVTPNMVKCADGSCRASRSDCPTAVTCPIGLIMCENGACSSSVSDCSAAVACALPKTRCPDGSCRDNLALCGSVVSCPAPTNVRCPNGACVSKVEHCASVVKCNAAAPFTCPDGSCAQKLTHCSTSISCNLDTPVLCPDGSCSRTISECPAVGESCEHHRCPDGTCVHHMSYCPSRQQCPNDRPVRCADGSCKSGISLCPRASMLTCKTGSSSNSCGTVSGVRCPTGHCASSFDHCPSATTCPRKYVRCSDGVCRLNCNARDAKAEIICQSNEVTCPVTASGITCATSWSECPTGVQCPPDKPVKCQDASCAMSALDCVRLTNSSVGNSKIACPDGSWEDEANQCGETTSCTSELPVKCWDKTCRLTVEDCPPIPSCPAAAPFLCPNGACVSTQDRCFSSLVCRDEVGSQSDNAGPTHFVKCAYKNSNNKYCVNSVSQCPKYNETRLAKTSDSCPDNMLRCFDGSCQSPAYCRKQKQFGTCKDSACFNCPAHLPFLCEDGGCALTLNDCLRVRTFYNTTGCPREKPFLAGNASSEVCAKDRPSGNSKKTHACPTGLFPCLDNTCRASCSCDPTLSIGVTCNAVLANGCLKGQVMCRSKVCRDPAECSSANDEGANVCPHHQPYRCPDGFCALSKSVCPIFGKSEEECKDNGVRCASGDCVASSELCPHLTACEVNEYRCPGSGACVPKLGAQFDTNANVCNMSNFHKKQLCPKDRPVRCAESGLCVQNADMCSLTLAGCPKDYTKCPNGHCVFKNATCPAPENIMSSCKFRCPDGTCSFSEADCTAKSPSFCGNKTSGNYHLCSDGSCAELPAWDAPKKNTCKLNIACPNRKRVLCADGSCVSRASLCPPVICPPSFVYCAASAKCLNTTSESCSFTNCPASRPVLCADGSCVSSGMSCEIKKKFCASSEFQCWDGECVLRPAKCAEKRFNLVRNTKTDAEKANAWKSWKDFYKVGNVNTLCPPGTTLCFNGMCTADANLCPVVPACPEAYPIRNKDGSCAKATRGDFVEGRTTTCASGVAQAPCSPNNGCGLNMRYCPRSRTICVPAASPCPAEQEPTGCDENCQKFHGAFVQKVFVPKHQSITFPVSLDKENNPRTLVTVPSGAHSQDNVALTFVPYPIGSLADVSKILSTPFKCSGPASNMNFTVSAAIDTQKFDKVTQDKTVGTVTGCAFQGSFTVREIEKSGFSCTGVGSITSKTISMAFQPEGRCNATNSTYQLLRVQEKQAWNPVDRTARSWFEVGENEQDLNKRCFEAFRLQGQVIMFDLTVEKGNLQNECANTTASFSTLLNTTKSYFFTRTSDSVDSCAAVAAARNIQPIDVCLAVLSGGSFTCIEKYDERRDLKFEVDNAGNSRHQGRFKGCDNRIYAFYNEPLGDPDPIKQPEAGMCDEVDGVNPCVVGAAVGGTLFFLFALGAYVIWRLMRYRTKYREEKDHLDHLADRAAELDEFSGGLGIGAGGDDDIDMIANPLVIEMQELEEQIKKVQEDMGYQAERDAKEIDNLEMERQRLYAEIERVKSEMAKAQSSAAPKRATEMPSVASTSMGGSNMMAASSVTQAKPTVKHGFGQVNRAKKKKL